MAATLEEIGWPVRTERLALRRAVAADLDATWRFRRLDEVTRWISAAPPTRAGYRTHFETPGRLAKTLVVELDGRVVGDLMLWVKDAWAQAEVAAAGEGRRGRAGLGPGPGVRRPRLRHRGGAGADPDLLRGPRGAPGDGELLRGQRSVLAADGAGGDAPRGARAAGVPAQVGRLARRPRLRAARRGVARRRTRRGRPEPPPGEIAQPSARGAPLPLHRQRRQCALLRGTGGPSE